jgi:L-2-hydroxyglutarate oxidase LhgO
MNVYIFILCLYLCVTVVEVFYFFKRADVIEEKVDITIIGAGLVGLAVADQLSSNYNNIVVLEKNDSYGQETSSRAGEIIHSGLYFPAGFFKGDFCRSGNRALYEICARRNVAHRKIGKIIVATGFEQIERLSEIKANGEENGVEDLSMISRRQIRKLEPNIRGEEGLLSPSTGIIDIHRLMRSFLYQAETNGAIVAYRSRVTGIHHDGAYYVVAINQGEYYFKTKILINSAGLYSDQIAAFAGIDIEKQGYRIHYNKGSFFSSSSAPKLNHLVWPVNPKRGHQTDTCRGVHTEIDLAGSIKFGPHWEYVNEINYAVDESKRKVFYQSIRNYLPSVPFESIIPSMSGIRPQLQGPHDQYKDFVIKDEANSGYPGLINLIGIECPGLTTCIPIARYVAMLVKSYFE